MRQRSSRRDFMKQAAAVGLGAWITQPDMLALAYPRSAIEKPNFAGIGVGGKGSSDISQAAELGNVVAICDIDDNRLQAKAGEGKFKEARKYHDFRKMLDELGSKIDAVVVSTPDHTHAPASVMAMKMGKHVYCQKPLTWSVHEARVMRETAARYKVSTQMGNQGTAEDGLRRAVEIIRDGVIGPVTAVHVWTNRPTGFWGQAPEVMKRPDETPAIPPHVHWDEFLGPAPERPYHPTYHPFAWRGWLDFGTGALGDMACHTANMAFMALKLGYPTSVYAEADNINNETFPSWMTVTLQFPARENMPPVKWMWYEGFRDGKKNLPPLELMYGQKPSDSGSILVGEKGVLYSPNDYGAAYLLFPKENFEGYKGPDPYLARNGRGDLGMKEEWVAAMHGGPAPFSNFDYAGVMTEAVLLGNVAMRSAPGTVLHWDGPSMKITNNEAANAFLGREYRSGWTL